MKGENILIAHSVHETNLHSTCGRSQNHSEVEDRNVSVIERTLVGQEMAIWIQFTRERFDVLQLARWLIDENRPGQSGTKGALFKGEVVFALELEIEQRGWTLFPIDLPAELEIGLRRGQEYRCQLRTEKRQRIPPAGGRQRIDLPPVDREVRVAIAFAIHERYRSDDGVNRPPLFAGIVPHRAQHRLLAEEVRKCLAGKGILAGVSEGPVLRPHRCNLRTSLRFEYHPTR
jgi:hypothetical protein